MSRCIFSISTSYLQWFLCFSCCDDCSKPIFTCVQKSSEQLFFSPDRFQLFHLWALWAPKDIRQPQANTLSTNSIFSPLVLGSFGLLVGGNQIFKDFHFLSIAWVPATEKNSSVAYKSCFRGKRRSSSGASKSCFRGKRRSSSGASKSCFKRKRRSSSGASKSCFRGKRRSSSGASKSCFKCKRRSSSGASKSCFKCKRRSSSVAYKSCFKCNRRSSSGASRKGCCYPPHPPTQNPKNPKTTSGSLDHGWTRAVLQLHGTTWNYMELGLKRKVDKCWQRPADSKKSPERHLQPRSKVANESRPPHNKVRLGRRQHNGQFNNSLKIQLT